MSQNYIIKREILRRASKSYDPLGMFSPVTMRSKICLHDLWNRKLDWDEIIPQEIMTHWYKINQDMEKGTTIKLSRRFSESDTNETGGPVLHVFTDASKVAYGAWAYLVKGNESAFRMAKNRVASLKQLLYHNFNL